MKLYEFNIFNSSFRPVYYSYTITCCNRRISSSTIYLSISTECQKGNTGKNLFNSIGFRIQHINSITIDIRGRFGYQISKMMLRYNIDDQAMFYQVDIRGFVNST